MTLPELYIIRHGETEWNRAARMQGGLDSALTELGRAQADQVAATLAGIIHPDTHDLWSSPQGRALATAEPISKATGCPVVAVDGLREIHMGDWVGLSRSEIDAKWPAPSPDEHFIDFYRRAPNAESFPALWDRVGQVLDHIRRPTVIITHGFTSRFLRTRALGLSLEDIGQVDGGQGVIFRIKNGQHEIFEK